MVKTSFFRLYAKWRMRQIEALDVVEVQRGQLLSLVERARDTDFGRAHAFSEIRSVKDYQKRVPLRDHGAFWSQWWKEKFPVLINRSWPGRISNYTISSGTTTGITKYFPFTKEMILSQRKAGLDMLVYHAVANPQSRFLDGLSFFLGGSSVFVEEAPGVYSSDVSDLMMKNLPFWAKRNHYPRGNVSGIKGWEERIERLSRDSVNQDIRILSGVPSWLLILFDKLKEVVPAAQGRLANIYPNLEMLIHGGVNFEPYRKLFNEMLEGSKAELREVYPASECYFASQDRGSGQGMRMTLDHNVFFEFVPLKELGSSNPTRHWIEDIRTDINYAIALSSPAGLWSYLIGDTVRFVETRPARLLVTGRTHYMLSAFGEHLIEEEIQEALSYAAALSNVNIIDFAVGPLYPKSSSDLGGHLFVIETAEQNWNDVLRSEFIKNLDFKLCETSDDYKAHRANGIGLNPPKLLAVNRGSFKEWMKSRGKLGGQNKVPRIINDQGLFENLIDFACDEVASRRS